MTSVFLTAGAPRDTRAATAEASATASPALTDADSASPNRARPKTASQRVNDQEGDGVLDLLRQVVQVQSEVAQKLSVFEKQVGLLSWRLSSFNPPTSTPTPGWVRL